MGDEKVKMRKQLGLLEGVAIILGIIFGSGIFISPKEVLEKTGSVWGALSVWAACGGLATLGAMSYAELGKSKVPVYFYFIKNAAILFPQIRRNYLRLLICNYYSIIEYFSIFAESFINS